MLNILFIGLLAVAAIVSFGIASSSMDDVKEAPLWIILGNTYFIVAILWKYAV